MSNELQIIHIWKVNCMSPQFPAMDVNNTSSDRPKGLNLRWTNHVSTLACYNISSSDLGWWQRDFEAQTSCMGVKLMNLRTLNACFDIKGFHQLTCFAIEPHLQPLAWHLTDHIMEPLEAGLLPPEHRQMAAVAARWLWRRRGRGLLKIAAAVPPKDLRPACCCRCNWRDFTTWPPGASSTWQCDLCGLIWQFYNILYAKHVSGTEALRPGPSESRQPSKNAELKPQKKGNEWKSTTGNNW